jgi:hypothetical protein
MNVEPAKEPTRQKGAINSLQPEDLPVHGWYRFVLSYPPHLVRQYLKEFKMSSSDIVLDPFCGTGTTVVEAKKNGIQGVGCDAHPFAAMVSRVKTNWTVDVAALRKLFKGILNKSEAVASKHGVPALGFVSLLLQEEFDFKANGFCLTPDEAKLLPTGFLSQRPLVRLLIIRDQIESDCKGEPAAFREFFLLALAHVIANGAGNFAFGPEIYRTKAKADYDVLGHFAKQCDLMLQEMLVLQKSTFSKTPSSILLCDARDLSKVPDGISCVITSPPYPNEKDYTRTTRVESILLGLLTDRESLRDMKESLLRSNTRNVFVKDNDSAEVLSFPSIQKVCRDIEDRRIELKKDSGFEKLYHKVVGHYFGGMRRHLRALKPKLRRGAKLAYVVGDQLSFLMVPVATASLLSEVAQAEGYKTIGCNLWRERIGTKIRNSTTNQTTVRVREEILLLQKP